MSEADESFGEFKRIVFKHLDCVESQVRNSKYSSGVWHQPILVQ